MGDCNKKARKTHGLTHSVPTILLTLGVAVMATVIACYTAPREPTPDIQSHRHRSVRRRTMLFGGFGEPQQRSRPSFGPKDKEFLHQRQNEKCNGCGEKLPLRQLAVDHIKPFSKGGSDKPSNLQLLCTPCNSMKGNGTQAQFLKRLKDKGLGSVDICICNRCAGPFHVIPSAGKH